MVIKIINIWEFFEPKALKAIHLKIECKITINETCKEIIFIETMVNRNSYNDQKEGKINQFLDTKLTQRQINL